MALVSTDASTAVLLIQHQTIGPRLSFPLFIAFCFRTFQPYSSETAGHSNQLSAFLVRNQATQPSPLDHRKIVSSSKISLFKTHLKEHYKVHEPQVGLFDHLLKAGNHIVLRARLHQSAAFLCKNGQGRPRLWGNKLWIRSRLYAVDHGTDQDAEARVPSRHWRAHT